MSSPSAVWPPARRRERPAARPARSPLRDRHRLTTHDADDRQLAARRARVRRPRTPAAVRRGTGAPTGASSMTAGSGASRTISPSSQREHGLDAHLARELGLRLQMARLAVHRHDDLRPHPAVHLAQLVAARVTGDVHQRFVVGQDIAAVARQVVLDAPDRLLVARDGARGEDHDIALVERDLRVLLLGDARERGARLALAAGAQQHDVAAVEVGELVLVEVLEALRQVAGIDGDLDHAVQRAPRNDELAAGRPRRVGHAFDARHVGGERRHRDAALGAS